MAALAIGPSPVPGESAEPTARRNGGQEGIFTAESTEDTEKRREISRI